LNIRPEEVSSIIKKEIDNYKKTLEIKTSGTVLEVGDGIARIYGLSNVMSGELLEFPHGVMGMALNLEEDNVGAVILGYASLIKEGDEVDVDGLKLFHLNQYLFYKDLKSLEWLKDNHADMLSNFVVTFGIYRDKTLLKWYLDRKINNETAIQSLFYYEKNTRQFIRKEMVLAVDKLLRGTPNEHDFAINAAKYYVQRYSHDFDNPKEIIDFLFNSSRGYYIEDPDGYSNIRADKSTSSKILGKVKSGEKIDVLDDTSNWYLIKTKEGLKGYVHKSRIKIK